MTMRNNRPGPGGLGAVKVRGLDAHATR
jgi:hypothetical protein